MVLLYDPETNSMTEFMDLKTETRNFSAVILGDEIITMAGYSGSVSYLNEVFHLFYGIFFVFHVEI